MSRQAARTISAGILVAAALGGCGVASNGHTPAEAIVSDGGSAQHGSSGLRAHPQAVDPVAGEAAQLSAPAAAPSSVSVSSTSGQSGQLPQPISEAEVKAELAESGISANPDQATLTPGGLAIAPVNAPPAVQAVIAAANEIARLPYIWGGGHQTYEDTGYDCSGSLSFILAAGGLLNQTETSWEFENYGDPGPGKWITIFATDGHTFAYIAGLRFDTVALAETGSRWSNRPADEPDLSSFVARHPPGL